MATDDGDGDEGGYALFTGCVSKSMCTENTSSVKAVCKAFDIDLIELKDATCSGARDLHQAPFGPMRINSDEPDLEIMLNARNLSLAEELGRDMMTICNTCSVAVKSVDHRLKHNPALLDNTNEVLEEVTGRRYEATIDVKHFVNVMLDDVGVGKLKARTVRPLAGMKVGPFYGCHSLRPDDFALEPDSEHPTSLEELIEACGGEVADYERKLSCCGFHVKLSHPELAAETSGDALQGAKAAGADAMVSPCPLCHMAFDLWQDEAEEAKGERFQVPQLHAAQLVGIAIGLPARDLGLHRHVVDTSLISLGV